MTIILIQTTAILLQVTGACFCLVTPTPVMNPRLVALSSNALGLLDIDPEYVNEQVGH